MLDISALAPPVVVNVAVLGFGAPYSVGFLNCFSLAILCDETVTTAFLTLLLSIKTEPKISPSVLVVHAG